MKKIILAFLLLTTNFTFCQQIPDKPKPSEYRKWEKMIGIPKIVKYMFFGISSKRDEYEYLCIIDKNNKIIPIGVRNTKNDSVFWKKEYLVNKINNNK